MYSSSHQESLSKKVLLLLREIQHVGSNHDPECTTKRMFRCRRQRRRYRQLLAKKNADAAVGAGAVVAGEDDADYYVDPRRPASRNFSFVVVVVVLEMLLCHKHYY